MAYNDPNQPPGFGQAPSQAPQSSQAPPAQPWENTPEPQPNYETLGNQAPSQGGSSWQSPSQGGSSSQTPSQGRSPWESPSPTGGSGQGQGFGANPYGPTQPQGPYPTYGAPHYVGYTPAPARKSNLWVIPLVIGIVVVMGFTAFGGFKYITAHPESRSGSGSTSATDQGTNEPGIVGTSDLYSGDCINGLFGDEIDYVDVVTCSEVHTSEVISIVDIEGFGYPSDEEFDKIASRECDQVAYKLGFDSEFDLGYIYPLLLLPTEENWVVMDHTAICTIEVAEGNTITGSFLDGTAVVQGTSSLDPAEEEPSVT